ncbi:hypothetical protein P3T27_007687 [Kitasatospora sp. MAA19]|uniref:hypothetical protein n=1 Tax=unclassified Kitasatospora TaxID=2633591 RepID=UPI002473E7DA|nr:hypothetical protein [Kitasatospora sp. MAA19]MDH6710936.1 hypothetical protein [Kitasatospora sp. MAA19]
MPTVTTTSAAIRAGVTVATIRTWCRTGAIAAVKQAGKWAIDAASLTYRIKLPSLLRKTPSPIVLTADMVVALGGRRWQKNGMDRVYISDWAEFAGLDVSYYGSGNVSGATLRGRAIANSRAGRLLGAIDRLWFDAADGRLHARHYDADAVDIRYLDGARDTVNLLARTFAGIKTAAAAL